MFSAGSHVSVRWRVYALKYVRLTAIVPVRGKGLFERCPGWVALTHTARTMAG